MYYKCTIFRASKGLIIKIGQSTRSTVIDCHDYKSKKHSWIGILTLKTIITEIITKKMEFYSNEL